MLYTNFASNKNSSNTTSAFLHEQLSFLSEQGWVYKAPLSKFSVKLARSIGVGHILFLPSWFSIPRGGCFALSLNFPFKKFGYPGWHASFLRGGFLSGSGFNSFIIVPSGYLAGITSLPVSNLSNTLHKHHIPSWKWGYKWQCHIWSPIDPDKLPAPCNISSV